MEEYKKCERCGQMFLALSSRATLCEPCIRLREQERNQFYKALNREKDRERQARYRDQTKEVPLDVLLERAAKAYEDKWLKYQKSDELGKMAMLVEEFNKLHHQISSYGDLQNYAQFHGVDYIHERRRIERGWQLAHEEHIKKV